MATVAILRQQLLDRENDMEAHRSTACEFCRIGRCTEVRIIQERIDAAQKELNEAVQPTAPPPQPKNHM